MMTEAKREKKGMGLSAVSGMRERNVFRDERIEFAVIRLPKQDGIKSIG